MNSLPELYTMLSCALGLWFLIPQKRSFCSCTYTCSAFKRLYLLPRKSLNCLQKICICVLRYRTADPSLWNTLVCWAQTLGGIFVDLFWFWGRRDPVNLQRRVNRKQCVPVTRLLKQVEEDDSPPPPTHPQAHTEFSPSSPVFWWMQFGQWKWHVFAFYVGQICRRQSHTFSSVKRDNLHFWMHVPRTYSLSKTFYAVVWTVQYHVILLVSNLSFGGVIQECVGTKEELSDFCPSSMRALQWKERGTRAGGIIALRTVFWFAAFSCVWTDRRASTSNACKTK